MVIAQSARQLQNEKAYESKMKSRKPLKINGGEGGIRTHGGR